MFDVIDPRTFGLAFIALFVVVGLIRRLPEPLRGPGWYIGGVLLIGFVFWLFM